MTIKDALAQWPALGPAELMWRPSLFSNENLKKIINENIGNKPFQRGCVWHSTDLNRGEVVVFDEKVNQDFRTEAIASSASIPGCFPPVQHKDHLLVDGFVYVNLALSEAVLKCREFGFDDKNIIIDIILCHGSQIFIEPYTKQDLEYLNAYDMWNRQSNIRSYYEHYQDVFREMEGFPNVNFRHLVGPTV